MTPQPDKNSVDLSALDFGPAWARGGSGHEKPSYREPRERKGGKERRGGQGKHKGRNTRGGQGFERKPRREAVQPTAGVTAKIMPREEGVDNMAKEITAAGRTYSVFELARVIMGARDRFNIVFELEEAKEGADALGVKFFQCQHDPSIFLTKDECLAHAATAEWLAEYYTEEEIEVEPPSGNFTSIAKCGYSSELLGPSNFHGYQKRIQEVHRAKFPHVPIEQYKSKIVTESGEEIVEAWKQSMTKKLLYKWKQDEKVILESKTAMLHHFKDNELNKAFRETHKAVVPSDLPGKSMSPGLLQHIKELVANQRRYPGDLASFLCRQLTGRQLAVFKWKGKLHAGPSRPKHLPGDLKIADRPAKLHQWVDAHAGAGIDAMWKELLPEDISEKDKLEWYHDLHWLINEGYVVFMNSGHLFPSSAAKKKKAEPAANRESPNQEKPEPAAQKHSQSEEVTKDAGEETSQEKPANAEPSAEK